MPSCRCGCGASLAQMRSDAIWYSDACRKRGPARQSAEIARNPTGWVLPYCLLALIVGAHLSMAVA